MNMATSTTTAAAYSMNSPSPSLAQTLHELDDIWTVAAGLFLDDAPLDMEHLPVQPHASHLMPLHHHDSDDAPDSPPTHKSSSKRINRRREELLFLRQQVQDLEQRLAQSHLRLQQIEHSQRSVDIHHREQLREAWAAIAAQQLAQRQASELEHDRLISMLQDQKRQAKALQRYARRLQNQPVPALLSSQLQLPRGYDSTTLDSPYLFDELQRALGSMYHQRDAIFSDSRFNHVLSSFQESRVVNPRTTNLCVELLETRIVPFSVQQTADAVWQSMIERLASTVAYSAEDVNPHIVKKSFVAALDLPKVKANVHGKVVAQRIDEGSRVTILRATQFSPFDLIGTDISPFSVRHYQWTVIEAPRHDRLRHNGHNVAQIESFDLSFPKMDELGPLDDDQEAALVEVCQSAVSYHVSLSRQSTENILVMNSAHGAATNYPSAGSWPGIKLEVR